MFLIIVAVNEIGEYIGDNSLNYSCPSYCEVDHEHIKSRRINENTGIDSTILVQRRDERNFSEGFEREHKYPIYRGEDRRKNH